MKLQAKRQKISPYYIFMLLHCHTTNLHINWDLVFTTRFIRLFGIRYFFTRWLSLSLVRSLQLSGCGDDAHSDAAHIWECVCIASQMWFYIRIYKQLLCPCCNSLKLNIMWPPIQQCKAAHTHTYTLDSRRTVRIDVWQMPALFLCTNTHTQHQLMSTTNKRCDNSASTQSCARVICANDYRVQFIIRYCFQP